VGHPYLLFCPVAAPPFSLRIERIEDASELMVFVAIGSRSASSTRCA